MVNIQMITDKVECEGDKREMKQKFSRKIEAEEDCFCSVVVVVGRNHRFHGGDGP